MTKCCHHHTSPTAEEGPTLGLDGGARHARGDKGLRSPIRASCAGVGGGRFNMMTRSPEREESRETRLRNDDTAQDQRNDSSFWHAAH
jgi:hypothetical protein